MLIKKGDFEFADILSSGYKIAEDVHTVAAEIVTAAGYPRRSFYKNPVTTITLTLCHLDDATMAEYLSQLSGPTGIYTYWSPKRKVYRRAEFYVDVAETVLVAEDDSGKVYDEYIVTLTQKGDALDVQP